MSPSVRRRLVAGLVGLLACAPAVAPSPASAAGGSYTYMLCANPDTGVGTTPQDGMFPDGVTMRPGHWNMIALQGDQRCSGQVNGGRGMLIAPRGSYSLDQSAGASFSFTAPDQVRFVGATVFRRVNTDHGMISAFTRSTSEGIYAKPQWDHCEDPNWGCKGRGSYDAFAPGNAVAIGQAHDGMTNGFKWFLKCAWWVCNVTNDQQFSLYGGKVALADDRAPSGTLGTGGLGSDAVLKGTERVAFSAADGETGVYRSRVEVDGIPQPWSVVDAGSSTCRDVNPGNADDYEFGRTRPCPGSLNGVAELDTTKLREGTHDLVLVVEDAGGRTVRLLDRQDVPVDNVAPPTVASEGAVTGSPRRGNTLLLARASWLNGGAAGEPSVATVWERCARDGGSCSPVAGAEGPTYVPGDADLNRRLRVVETATNSEGSATTRTALTDVIVREDGSLPVDNNGEDDDGDGQVDEPGEAKPAPAAPPTSGPDKPSGAGATPVQAPAKASAGSGGAGSSSSSSSTSSEHSSSSVSTSSGGAGGALNGEGASPRARLTVGWSGGRGRVAFGRDATATGRLVDDEGRPIRNAIVDVVETPAVRGARAAAGRPAVTDADGAFAYTATSRPGSRALRFAYRYQRQGAVVASGDLALRVASRVRFSVKLRGVVASYRGRVLAGAMPAGGKLVIVQGRAKGGSWQTFASRRARRSGAFSGRYRLKVRRPGKQLQFRVRVVGESGWNFGPATSKAVTRTVR